MAKIVTPATLTPGISTTLSDGSSGLGMNLGVTLKSAASSCPKLGEWSSFQACIALSRHYGVKVQYIPAIVPEVGPPKNWHYKR